MINCSVVWRKYWKSCLSAEIEEVGKVREKITTWNFRRVIRSKGFLAFLRWTLLRHKLMQQLLKIVKFGKVTSCKNFYLRSSTLVKTFTFSKVTDLKPEILVKLHFANGTSQMELSLKFVKLLFRTPQRDSFWLFTWEIFQGSPQINQSLSFKHKMAKNSKKSKSSMIYLNGNSHDSKASYTVKSLLYIFIPLHFINVTVEWHFVSCRQNLIYPIIFANFDSLCKYTYLTKFILKIIMKGDWPCYKFWDFM